MRYDDLVERYVALEATMKRLELTDQLVRILRETTPEEVASIVYLTMGTLGPDWEAGEVGLAEKLVLKALGFTTGLAEDDLVDLLHAHGDLGSAAEVALTRERAGDGGEGEVGREGAARQTSLFETTGDGEGAAPPTVGEVHDALRAIAAASGPGSQDRKVQLLHRLLTGVTPLAARYIVRTVTGKLRLGVADMTLVDALAYLAAFPEGVEDLSVQEMSDDERARVEDARARIERAYNVSSDLGRVARLVVDRGLAGLDDVGIQVGTPLRPMLAERLQEPEEILEKTGGRCALETKYDGLRLQAHLTSSGPARFFSRRLEDLTAQFPDVAESLRASFRGEEAIVEGEAVAVDPDTGRMLPFQRLSKRRGRKHDLDRMIQEVPVAVYLFDLMLLDGEDLTRTALPTRRSRLEEAFEETDAVRFSHQRIAESAEEVLEFFDQSVADGAEGIMAKSLGEESTYRAGARGWQWIKFKKDYAEELGDSLDLVVVGAFWGRGRRRGWYGSLLMATYDPHRDVFETLCKVATGFDDETLKELEPSLEPHVLDHVHPRVESELEPDVWLAPARVAEVRAADITVSPVHTAARGAVREDAGLALRFPRFMGWRPDKAPEDATTPEEVVGMYERQGPVAAGEGEDAPEG